jgi:hypothetical protein
MNEDVAHDLGSEAFRSIAPHMLPSCDFFLSSFLSLDLINEVNMSLIPTASKPPTFADVVSGKQQPSKERECYLSEESPPG